DPRHDARHDRQAAGRTPDLPGRPRPHVAPARQPRRVGQARSRPARARVRRSRRDEPRVYDYRRPARDRARRPADVRGSRPVRELPVGDRPRGTGARGSIRRARRPPPAPGRDHRDFALISTAFTAAYFLAVHGSGTNYQRHVATVALPVVLFARYATFIPFGLYRGVWRYAGARDAA